MQYPKKEKQIQPCSKHISLDNHERKTFHWPRRQLESNRLLLIREESGDNKVFIYGWKCTALCPAVVNKSTAINDNEFQTNRIKLPLEKELELMWSFVAVMDHTLRSSISYSRSLALMDSHTLCELLLDRMKNYNSSNTIHHLCRYQRQVVYVKPPVRMNSDSLPGTFASCHRVWEVIRLPSTLQIRSRLILNSHPGRPND